MKTKKYLKINAFTVFVFFVSLFPLADLIATPDASAQEVDLVDLKKKEDKRKKKTKKSKYVVTNDNIEKIKVPKKSYGFIKVENKDDKAKALNDQLPSAGSGVSQTAGGEGSVAPSGTAKDKREYWQTQMRQLLTGINELKNEINKNQAELNHWEFRWSTISDFNEQKKKREEIEQLRTLIPQQQKELAELEKKKEKLELRARKDNVPAGWLRIDDLEKPPPQKDKKKDKDKEKKQSNG